MQFQYAAKRNYEDLASGKVLYHKAGLSTFPVRLASEIFMRCLDYLGQPSTLSLYDPLCGEAYLLTTLGFLHRSRLVEIYGSDLNPEALEYAKKNLALLEEAALENRIAELEGLHQQFQKESHREAIQSAQNLLVSAPTESGTPKQHIFQQDMLQENALAEQDFKVDLVITDVPYGSMVEWQGDSTEALNRIVENLLPVLKAHSIVAIISDKGQKFQSPYFERKKLLRHGKRRIEIVGLA